MSKKKVVFRVEFELPEGATVASAREYVDDALQSYCGGLRPPMALHEYDPGDPFFDYDDTMRNSLKITQIREPKKAA